MVVKLLARSSLSSQMEKKHKTLEFGQAHETYDADKLV